MIITFDCQTSPISLQSVYAKQFLQYDNFFSIVMLSIETFYVYCICYLSIGHVNC